MFDIMRESLFLVHFWLLLKFTLYVLLKGAWEIDFEPFVALSDADFFGLYCLLLHLKNKLTVAVRCLSLVLFFDEIT